MEIIVGGREFVRIDEFVEFMQKTSRKYKICKHNGLNRDDLFKLLLQELKDINLVVNILKKCRTSKT